MRRGPLGSSGCRARARRPEERLADDGEVRRLDAVFGVRGAEVLEDGQEGAHVFEAGNGLPDIVLILASSFCYLDFLFIVYGSS